MVNKYFIILFHYILLFSLCLGVAGCHDPDDVIRAAKFGDLQSLVKSLDAGTQIDHADPAGETALFHVIGSGSQKGFDLLMERGASTQVRDIQGNTALHKAATFSRERFAEELINMGVKVNSTNKVGATPLHYAVRNGDKGITKLLLKNGAEKNILDFQGNSVVNVVESMLNQDSLSDSMGNVISKNSVLNIEKILKQ
ncbi:MAG: ankyrin repeat domain-containing protein [Verrucomicrobiota bacterium]|nr:ankyrin repeat domain-containing protein [Verrucomicrobiota bacterium]MEE2614030.1 ankyrin repeat domain-containing protein [Verrucomicrobiota bacterium]